MSLHYSISHIIRLSILLGVLAGTLFIILQSSFDMGSITSRHADAYLANTAFTPVTATILAWFVHLLVSVIYAGAAVLIFSYSHAWYVSVIQITVLGWLTTLIATPANVFVMKWVSTASIPIMNTLPDLNTNIDAKLLLHIVFYVLVLLPMYALNSMQIKGFTRLG